MRLQSAIEYLSTYGWAILILAVALSVLGMAIHLVAKRA